MSEQVDLASQASSDFPYRDEVPALTLWEWLAGVVFPIFGACIAAVMFAPGLLESKRASFFSVTTFLAAPAFGVISSAYIFATWPSPSRTLFNRSFRAGWMIVAGGLYNAIAAPFILIAILLGRNLLHDPGLASAGLILVAVALPLAAFVYIRRVHLHPFRKAMPWSGMAAGALLAFGIPIVLVVLGA